MDMNERIAARRRELAQQEAEKTVAAKAERDRAAEQEARAQKAAAAKITEEINTGGEAKAINDDGVVSLVHDPDAALFGPEIKNNVRRHLFKQEARKRWTPLDQWVVISLISGGICLLHLAGLGILFIGAGLICRHVFNKRCRRELREIYPNIFGSARES